MSYASLLRKLKDLREQEIKMRKKFRVDWSKLPDVIGYAFKVAHRPEDVFVACRMADRMHNRRGGYYGAYLHGKLFPENWDDDPAVFKEIRDSAPY